jgi:hypothetical protein
MYDNSRSNIPFWFWGVLVALVLILISRSGNLFGPNQALQQRFAPQPTIPGAAETARAAQTNWGDIPVGIQELIKGVQENLSQGQSAPVLTPVAQSARLKVTIKELVPTTGGVRVVGEVTNISQTPLDVPINAFQFRDSAGNIYASSATGTTRIEVGASAPLDLNVPLESGRGLYLVVRFSPDPPLEQMLISAVGES